MSQQEWPLVYVYDAYLRIEATSKEEADRRLMEIEIEVAATGDVELSILDAYGIEDAETGEEIREVS